jgi:hypothetical protein
LDGGLENIFEGAEFFLGEVFRDSGRDDFKVCKAYLFRLSALDLI